MSPATLEASPICQALRESPLAMLRKLKLHETETTVELRGTVPTYYLKQLAQETILPFLDGRTLINEVSVVRE